MLAEIIGLKGYSREVWLKSYLGPYTILQFKMSFLWKTLHQTGYSILFRECFDYFTSALFAIESSSHYAMQLDRYDAGNARLS